MIKEILKDNGMTLEELIIYACIDAGGVRKVTEDNYIELDPNQMKEVEQLVYNKLKKVL